MSRRSASPEAETRSYWPPPPLFISETISLDVPAYFALTWQPVCASNSFTHSGCVYPSHAMMFSLPSPFPMTVNVAMLRVGGWGPDTPLEFDGLAPFEPLLPHA